MEKFYVCPKGHKIAGGDPPKCPMCRLVATHYNYKTKEVYNWTPLNNYNSQLENLQDMIDEAFDHRYGFDQW